VVLLVGNLKLQELTITNIQFTMVCMEQLQFNNRHILSSRFRKFFKINRCIKVVNGKIQYFVKGQRVKPNEYYKFRSEISNK
jgi:hypothetical protein